MRVLTKDEFVLNYNRYVQEIRRAIYVYPTDTIYGIGCNALDDKLIKKLRKIKKSDQPFSIIAPNMDWITENCVINARDKKWLAKLPGPYTIILKLKNRQAVSPEVNLGNGTIGVRIPKHWIMKIVGMLGQPIITTSANLTGEDFMTNINDLSPAIKSKVDYIIYEGDKIARPSTIISLIDKKAIVKKR
jgi:tRNA threonylcarbamoyl adenosine modification protein (Sua5/YciO/YrdC/YwlC family)